VPVNLSKVFFIATANDLSSISAPLLDRMEIINLAGYTEYEKMEIGEKFLIPKVLRDSGLPGNSIRIDRPVLGKIINGHTREAGVRGLERKLHSICRYIAVDYTTKKQERLAK
jgi:ATP-dependent Lon protease